MHFTQSAQERGLPTVPVLVGYPWSSAPSLAEMPAGTAAERCPSHATAGTPGPGAEGRDFSAPQQPLSSLRNTTRSHPEERCPLLLDGLLHTRPKTPSCLSSSQACSLDLTTEADNRVPLPTQLLPGRERIYSPQIRGFSAELCFSAGNHYF